MREQTFKINTQKLASLSTVYKPTNIAKKLNISKQRWRHYETGKNDMPESVLRQICAEFNLVETDLVLQR